MVKSIGYLGPCGTFSHEAAGIYAEGQSCTLKEFVSIQDVLYAVKDNVISEAIVPIENSLEGAVNVTLDVLAKEEGLYIKGELVLPVSLNLVVKKGTSPNDITTIMSHPQPLGQAREFLNKFYPKVLQVEENSTAQAAKRVSEGDGTYAAITSRTAAKINGLEVLAANIQDVANNHTRFVIVSKEYSKMTGCDKTSIVFSTDNKPGSLYRVLDIFSLWDINMTRIESRPSKNALGQYIFS